MHLNPYDRAKAVQVSLSFKDHSARRPLRPHLHQVRSKVGDNDLLSSYGLKENRRKGETPTPWELITEDPAEIEQIKMATRNPELMLVSDWTRFKSWEYMEAEEKSALTIL